MSLNCKSQNKFFNKLCNYSSYRKYVIWTKTGTLVSGINVPGRLLIFKKISTQDKIIPATRFIYFWNFFHPLRLFRPLFLSSGTYNHEEIKNFSLITAIKTSYSVFSLIYSFLIIQTIKFEILRLPFLKHAHAPGVLLLAL